MTFNKSPAQMKVQTFWESANPGRSYNGAFFIHVQTSGHRPENSKGLVKIKSCHDFRKFTCFPLSNGFPKPELIISAVVQFPFGSSATFGRYFYLDITLSLLTELSRDVQGGLLNKY